MTRKQFSKAFDSLDIRKKNRENPLPGFLGFPLNGKKVVEVPTREGFVFVRLRGSTNELIQAYNDQVSPVYDLPVLVDRDSVDKSKYRIVGRDLGVYQNWGSSAPYLPRHGNTHSFNPDTGGGGDVVFVYGRQMMPLAVYPSGTSGAGLCMVSPSIYYQGSQWIYGGDAATGDLLPYKPTGANARMVLVYLDENGDPGLLGGDTYFATNITGSSGILNYLPTIPNANYVPLAGIRLVSGTSSVVWDNIYDVRPWIIGDGFIPTGSSAPLSSPFVTVGNDATLTNERALTAGAGISIVDNGPNSTIVISATGTSSGATGTSSVVNWNSIVFVPETTGSSTVYDKSNAGLRQAIVANTGKYGTIYIPNGDYTINTGTSSTLLSYCGQSMDNTTIYINCGGNQQYAFNTGDTQYASVQNLQFVINSHTDYSTAPGPTSHYGLHVNGSVRNVIVYMDHTKADDATGAGFDTIACDIVEQYYSSVDEPYPAVDNVTSYLEGYCTDQQVDSFKALRITRAVNSTKEIYANNCYGWCSSTGADAFGLLFNGGGDAASVTQPHKFSKLFNSKGVAVSSENGSNVSSFGIHLTGFVEANNCYAYSNAAYTDLYYTTSNSYSVAFDCQDSNVNVLRYYNCNGEAELSQDATHGTQPVVIAYRMYLNTSFTGYAYYSIMKNCRGLIRANAGTQEPARDYLYVGSYSTAGDLQIFDSVFNSELDNGSLTAAPASFVFDAGTDVVMLDTVINNRLYGTYQTINNEFTNIRDGLLIYDGGVFKGTGTAIDFNDNLNVIVSGTLVWVNSIVQFPVYDENGFVANGTNLVFGSGFDIAATGSSIFINLV